MNENKFVGFVEGWLATTDVDVHGDQLTLENLRRIKKGLDENPSKRILNQNHDTKKKIGEVLKSEIIKKDGWAGLKARVGIYSKETLKLMEERKLKGFSWSGKITIKNKLIINETKKYKFSLKIDGKHYHEVLDLVKPYCSEYTLELKKSADAATTISLVALSLEVFKILYNWWKDKKEADKEVNFIIIGDDNKIINFQDTSLEKVENILKGRQNEAKRHS